MAKKYDVPKLDNMTDVGLADLIGEYAEKEKEGKFYAGFYKEALKGRLKATQKLVQGTEVLGEKFCATVGLSETFRFDVTACREAAEKGDAEAASVLKRFTPVDGKEVVAIRVTERVILNKNDKV
jgi:hypothetical protein